MEFTTKTAAHCDADALVGDANAFLGDADVFLGDANAFLGIDIGSTTVKIAILDEAHRILFSDYERHFANIRET